MRSTPQYLIRHEDTGSLNYDDWNNTIWKHVDELVLKAIVPASTPPYPRTTVKLLYDVDAIHVFYRVYDYGLKCTQRNFLDPVHFDSCVEFFVRPDPGKGYFNFEFNCSGVLNGSYIEDWTITERGFGSVTKFTTEDRDSIVYHTSMPGFIEMELPSPTLWFFGFSVPFSFFGKYLQEEVSASDKWTANFYKCGDNTSRPHWCAWSEIPELNFHLPECFGKLCFDRE